MVNLLDYKNRVLFRTTILSISSVPACVLSALIIAILYQISVFYNNSIAIRIFQINKLQITLSTGDSQIGNHKKRSINTVTNKLCPICVLI